MKIRYCIFMSKMAISLTLSAEYLTWTRTRAIAVGSRSISDFIDQLIGQARSASPPAPIRSVVGTIDIDPSDPFMKDADDFIRAEFALSLARPSRAGASQTAGKK